MKPSITTALEKLVSFIEESHMGDYTAVSRDLYRAINYLHYLESGSVGVVELRNTCFTLYQLAERFYEADRLKENAYDPCAEKVAEEPYGGLTEYDLWGYRL